MLLQLSGVPMLAAQKKPQAGIPAGIPWTQWGGPHRNFVTEASGLRDVWPASGPRVMWRRALGEGYSAVSAEASTIYTMYGRSGEEVVLAASAATGKTMWEHSTPVSFRSGAPEMGNGPYAAPLLAGGQVFTAGVTGRLQSLDKQSGKVVWTQQLWNEHRGTRLDYGYASSPIAFRDLIIVPVGGPGRALMAFQQSDGKVRWSRNDFSNAYSSPVLIDLEGLEQMLMLMDGVLFAVNPHNGDLQWQTPFRADFGIAVSTPLWSPDHLLFVSAEYGAGTKVVELNRKGLKTTASVVWTSNRLRLHHGNAMRIEDTYYFSSGGKGSQAILSAVDARSGKIHWQERSISKSTFVWADGKMIVLDQDGTLMLAHPSPRRFQIVAKAELLTSLAWTPPALVGTQLYLRDRRTMVAVDLG